jgi:hypothetical protein
MNPAHNIVLRPSAGLPDLRVKRFAVKTSLYASFAITLGLHVVWDSTFWPAFWLLPVLVTTYLIGRFVGGERYAKQDARAASAAQACEEASAARTAVRQANLSAAEAEAVAQDVGRIAQDNPIAADAARKAAAAAKACRVSTHRAEAHAGSAEDNARQATAARSVAASANAAHQASSDRRDAVSAAEEATMHAMNARQMLEEAHAAIAREGASHEDLLKCLSRATEFAGMAKVFEGDANRHSAICQNITRELIPVAIALREPEARRLAERDGSIQSLLGSLDAELDSQNLELPTAQLVFTALGYRRRASALS